MSIKYVGMFNLGEKVHIDENKDIAARVVGVMWDEVGETVKVAWWHNGQHYAEWFAPMRLNLTEEV